MGLASTRTRASRLSSTSTSNRQALRSSGCVHIDIEPATLFGLHRMRTLKKLFARMKTVPEHVATAAAQGSWTWLWPIRPSRNSRSISLRGERTDDLGRLPAPAIAVVLQALGALVRKATSTIVVDRRRRPAYGGGNAALAFYMRRQRSATCLACAAPRAAARVSCPRDRALRCRGRDGTRARRRRCRARDRAEDRRCDVERRRTMFVLSFAHSTRPPA